MDWTAWLAIIVIVLALFYILMLGLVDAYFNAKGRFVERLAEKMRKRDGES